MGCVNSKKIKKEDTAYSPSSIVLVIQELELPMIELIKTKEQKRIENIQITFREEYIKLNYLRNLK